MKMNQIEMDDIVILHVLIVQILTKSQSPGLIQTKIIYFDMRIMYEVSLYDSEKNATI